MTFADTVVLILGIASIPLVYFLNEWVVAGLDKAFDYVWDHGLGAFLGFVFKLALIIGAIYALFVAPVVTLLVLILLVLIAR